MCRLLLESRGIIGGILGTTLGAQVGFNLGSELVNTLFWSVIGACILLFIIGLVKKA